MFNRFVALLIALALVAAACGSGDTTPAETASDESLAVPSSGPDDTAAAEDIADTGATDSDGTPDSEANDGDDTTGDTDAAPANDDADEAEVSEEAEPTRPPVLSSEVELVVYDGDFSTSILPIFADRCASCHAEGGPGASHWQITTAQDVVDNHELIGGVVEINYMPPWPASDASLAFRDNRDLRPDQVAAIVAWAADGAPLDVDPSTPIEPSNLVVGLVDPDRLIVPTEPYAGDPNNIDDYRCQIYDPQLPDGGWITGYEFIPDQTTVVHHAIGYVIEPNRADRAAARDGEDGRPGWECYGSSGLGGDDIFLGWAPGQDASLLPDGAGLYMSPGSFLVVQVHYHYEGDAPADASALALTLDESIEPDARDSIEVATLIAPVEIPCAEWEEGPLCDRDAAVADAIERFGDQGVQADRFNSLCGYKPEDFAHFDQGLAQSECTIPAAVVGATGEVVAVLGHMHEIGDWFRMTLNPGRPDEQVLLDIPNWDFDWQYNYVPEETLILDSDDEVLVECGWDRARRAETLEPAYIVWADGTNDEMCFATITVRR